MAKTETLENLAYRQATARTRQWDNFLRVFGISLKHFWIDNILGFNVIAFDDWLKTPDGISTRDFIRQKYGDEAVAIVEDLICCKKPEDGEE